MPCSTVAQAFFDLQAARGKLLGIGAAITRAELLVNFAEGLAPSLIAPLEINRARTELQSLRQTQQVAIRDWRVASAQLAEVLLLEPATLLEPIEPPFLQVTLVPCEQSPEELVPIALNNRPEIASRRELVAAARPAPPPGEDAPAPAEPGRRQPVDDHGVARRPATSAGRTEPGCSTSGRASTSRSPRSGSCRTAGSATSA